MFHRKPKTSSSAASSDNTDAHLFVTSESSSGIASFRYRCGVMAERHPDKSIKIVVVLDAGYSGKSSAKNSQAYACTTIEFESFADLKAWQDSPEWRGAKSWVNTMEATVIM